ncbi:isochorismatase family cysteine hydrolase [Rhizobium sp. Root1204]|uniref:cysteine hydrolase family protein n=1 Tax=Rhizobium sp. Root1204 TaxID=1736428 RepID=UPI000715C3CD|nr:isochorismatase family cysteine hydrolase [Rhizobium sp. Root1204]KQV41333.1 isochorismatase [Rhizobium sp. Root1204]
MHQIQIHPAQLARGRKNRDGREYVYADLEMARVAHIIVDLQNGFMAEGSVSEVPIAREIVDNVNAISQAVRAAGGLNVFLRYTYLENEEKPWDSWYKALLGSPFSTGLSRGFTPGNPEHEIWPAIDVAPGEPILDKTRFSGFMPGTCELDTVLRARGIDTVIITGTVTNCCSEATARDAHQMDYKVIFVSDGNAAMTDEEHNATLGSIYVAYGDVMSTGQILQIMQKRTAAAA